LPSVPIAVPLRCTAWVGVGVRVGVGVGRGVGRGVEPGVSVGAGVSVGDGVADGFCVGVAAAKRFGTVIAGGVFGDVRIATNANRAVTATSNFIPPRC
jgi:hypothetical protein